jgi:CubicO group peptidase (beta-lactamase class C family)
MKKLLLILACWLLTLPAISQNVQQRMDELVDAYAANETFNGVILVARKGEVIYQKAVGYRNAEAKTRHDAGSIFQIGSITKQFTAAIIMQLQEEGKLSVTDKLSKYFPGFANGDRITIAQLLSHTSGLYNYTNDTVLMRSDVTKHYTPAEMIDIFRRYKPDFEPGTGWNYSNTGYSLLGYIIEKVEGKPYEQVARQRIFQPLGMSRSGFDFTRLSAEEKAQGYFTLAGGVARKAPIVDSTIAHAAGAMYSTAGDLLKWERAVSNGKLLKPASWKEVFTPVRNKYGYGWGIDTLFGRDMAAHSGGIHGFTSYLIRFPKEELVVIAIDNHSAGLGGLCKAMAAIVFDAPYKVPAVVRTLTVDESVLKQYIGEYELAPGFVITVRLDGKQLTAQATGQDAFELFAESETMFNVRVVPARVEFVKEGGAVSKLILHQNGRSIPGKKIK